MGNAKVLAIAPLLLAMYGCSSSSDSTTPTNPVNPTTASGLFLDAEVEGLSYATSSGGSGTTDANGTYTYKTGDTISFSVGGVNLGTVDGAPKCTPFDFAAASTNIARFLQSLDADGDPTNGIDIVAANTALAGTTISSDAFLADDATFEANADIAAALSTTGDTLIDKATALSNLTTGTDTTFDNAELADKVFVVLDPGSIDIGIISFDANFSVSSIFPEDTTAGGGDGSGFDETWAIDGNGVLTLTSTGSVTTVNRIGGSTNAISVTYSEDGADPKPATLLIPRAITDTDLGGDTTTIVSKTYDVVDTDGGAAFGVTFNSDGTYELVGDPETGTYVANDIAPGVITIQNDAVATEITFLIMLDGVPTVVDETINMLIIGATIIGGTPSNPDLEFNEMGVGSVTLKSTTAAP